MKVLQAMAGAEHGGAEAFFTRLALALHRAGLDQRVVIRGWPGRAKALRAGGLEPVELAFGGRLDVLTAIKFRRAIKDYRPDIVMTWMNRATRFCPRGDFVHVARLGGYYNLEYYRACDHLVANTEDIADYLVDHGWAPSRVHYLPNFVTAERVAPASRDKLFTPKDAPLILAMGRLHKNKAFDVLLGALSQVADAYLWIAGEGPERPALEALAQHLAVKPRVRFLGWRDDTARLLAACDLFVCPSRHEPLGNVVIEAWAQGVPVVAADSLGPGTLIEQKETGVLVPVDDPRSLALAIRHVLENDELRSRMARKGHEVYEQRFTEARAVELYLAFFERVRGDKRPEEPA